MNKSLTVQQTRYHSWKTGCLAKGCQLCVHGQKLVIFITGLCGQRCFYCPISDKKFGNDVVFANEWKVSDPDHPEELIREAELCNAKGAGITGGDPLVNIDRCCTYIQLLKKKFGKEFHIHLYTPLQLVNQERLKRLADAGLDEIRFHPNLDDDSDWEKIQNAAQFSWDIGVEIPVIPGYEAQTKKLMDYIADKVHFLILNELELSDTETAHYSLLERGYKPKDNISYGVEGSKECAMKLLNYAQEINLRTHYCTAKLKDDVQVVQRIIRRAKNVSLPTDIVTDEGTLVRGCIYLPDIAPNMVGYRRLLKAYDKDRAYKELQQAFAFIQSLDISQFFIDDKKLRLIMSVEDAEEHAPEIKEHGLIPAIVEEFPTDDALETEVEYL